MTHPAITVLMSVHNGAAHLRGTIDSVFAQTWRDFEFLVIDDASDDMTPVILREVSDPRLRIVRMNENIGLTAALNRGLALARGVLIARQDADDVSQPRRLELQAAFLRENPGVAAVGSQARLIDVIGRSLGRKDFPLTHRAIEWMNIFDNALAHSAVTFRKAAVLDAGGYDESFPASQDYDLWTRLGARHALANLPQRLVTLRVLETSVTRTHRRPELIRRVQAAHLARLFPEREISGEELELIGQFRSRVADLPRFRALLDDLLARFQAAWPETRKSRDFARTVAGQHERIGYNLLITDRRAAWTELLRAMTTFPPGAFSMPWARIAALTFLGDSARALHGKLASS